MNDLFGTQYDFWAERRNSFGVGIPVDLRFGDEQESGTYFKTVPAAQIGRTAVSETL